MLKKLKIVHILINILPNLCKMKVCVLFPAIKKARHAAMHIVKAHRFITFTVATSSFDIFALISNLSKRFEMYTISNNDVYCTVTCGLSCVGSTRLISWFMSVMSKWKQCSMLIAKMTKDSCSEWLFLRTQCNLSGSRKQKKVNGEVEPGKITRARLL